MTTPIPTTPAVTDRFPVEVFDAVFDFVRLEDERAHNDKRSLFACSRVSRAWHSLTLRHRFHSVSLFARTGNPHEQRVRKNCFLQDFLESALFPTVQCHIQKLTLRWGIADLDPYIGADLPGFLASFPALRALKLRGLLGRALPAPSSAPAPPPRPRRALDTLALEGWVCHGRAHDPRAFLGLLRAFSALGELHLEDLAQWAPADDCDPAGEDYPAVSALVLRDSACPHPVCGVLEAAEAHARPLRRLDVRALGGGDARGEGLLVSFARSIEDLKCTVAAGPDAAAAATLPPYDFAPLAHLRTLTVAAEVPLTRVRARSLAGADADADADKGAPWARLAGALRTLHARARGAPLKLLHVQLAPARALADKAQTGAALCEALRRGGAGVRALEDVLLGLVGERCVQLVQVGVYAAPAASGLGEGCREPCGEFVVGLFPRLRQAGVLRV
ncbi:F-box protein [Phanerochaete sordida]|uniref:F-box protein n=1 Tax=Phanerochaete sordida TaxID=48140 RepID=A0A9P3LC67_9APHY|nr:F-box protein [Phanerochaete sordida]